MIKHRNGGVSRHRPAAADEARSCSQLSGRSAALPTRSPIGGMPARAIKRVKPPQARVGLNIRSTDWQALSALADRFLKAVPRGLASEAGRLVNTSLL